MRSSFFGLETAKRAIYAQQYAIYTTGHNIANANTEGYSRQRVNMKTFIPMEPVALGRSTIPGQMGTGVIVRDIVRLRDEFLDRQFRNQHQRLGDWETQLDFLEQIESVINEPSANDPLDETGLARAIDGFWEAWNTLAQAPQDAGNRRIVIEAMQSLAEAFNMKHSQLKQLEDDIKDKLQIKYDEANRLLQQIANLNKEIADVERLGDHANDLRDQRDLLVDQLSKIVDIRVEVKLVDGKEEYSIVLAGSEIELVNKEEVKRTFVEPPEDPNDPSFDSDKHVNVKTDVTGGEINGLLVSKDTVIKYIDQLNALAYTFVKGEVTLPNGTTLADGSGGVNGLHKMGFDKNGVSGSDLFVPSNGTEITAGTISVNPVLLSDESKLAPSLGAGTDDNIIAQLMAQLKTDGTFTFKVPVIDPTNPPSNGPTITNGTINNYYRAYTGQIGVETDSARREFNNVSSVIKHIDNRRLSVSAVSLDEEMANLIQFQHAYNAAARNMTTVDEMLDRIINGMGHVGR